MKVTAQHLNERKIVAGTLYSKARITVDLSPNAMRLFDEQREEPRDTFGLLRLEWIRFDREWDTLGNNGFGSIEATHDIAKSIANYEITLIGNGPLEEKAAKFLDWLCMTARLSESVEPPAVQRIVLVSPPIFYDSTIERAKRKELNPIIGIGNII